MNALSSGAFAAVPHGTVPAAANQAQGMGSMPQYSAFGHIAGVAHESRFGAPMPDGSPFRALAGAL